jgi:hypothetical protein
MIFHPSPPPSRTRLRLVETPDRRNRIPRRRLGRSPTNLTSTSFATKSSAGEAPGPSRPSAQHAGPVEIMEILKARPGRSCLSNPPAQTPAERWRTSEGQVPTNRTASPSSTRRDARNPLPAAVDPCSNVFDFSSAESRHSGAASGERAHLADSRRGGHVKKRPRV